MTQLPQDPFILVSVVNAKLRDRYGGSLDAMCEDLQLDREALTGRLREAGFEFSEVRRQFV